jgi:O-antigen/teichoic acid export membrane protein
MTPALVKWLKGKAAGTLVVAAGTLVSQAIVVIALFWLARLYAPADFGVLATYLGILGVLQALGPLKLDSAFLLTRPGPESLSVAVAALIAATSVATLATLGLWILCLWLPMLGSIPPMLLFVVPVGVAVGVVGQILMAHSARNREYPHIARARVVTAVSQAIFQGAGAFAGVLGGAIGLVLGDVSGRALGVLSLRAAAGTLCASGLNPPDVWRSYGTYRSFMTIAAPSQVMNTLVVYLPSLMVLPLYGPAQAGFLAGATRLLGAPLNIFAEAGSQVFGPEAGHLIRTDPGRLRQSVLSFVVPMALMATAVVAVVLAFGEMTIRTVLGPQWLPAASYLVPVAVFCSARAAVLPVSQTLILTGAYRMQAGWEGTRLVALGIVTLVCMRNEASALAWYNSYAATMAFFYVVLIALVLWRTVHLRTAPETAAVASA